MSGGLNNASTQYLNAHVIKCMDRVRTECQLIDVIMTGAVFAATKQVSVQGSVTH